MPVGKVEGVIHFYRILLLQKEVVVELVLKEEKRIGRFKGQVGEDRELERVDQAVAEAGVG